MNINLKLCIIMLIMISIFSPAHLYAQIATTSAVKPIAVLPMDRTAYFIGEKIPIGLKSDGDIKLEAVKDNIRTIIYTGKSGAIMLDTSKMAPGDYSLELNGVKVIDRLTLSSVLRKSAGSLQDEVIPSDKLTSDDTAKILKETGLTACVNLGASDMGRAGVLDAMARTGTLMLVNPETRPTSFFPPWNNPGELDGMSQRMILTAQANGRYPNFGGFCYGWDTTGYAVGGRLGLLIYWGWGNLTQSLRNYIECVDKQKMDEFTKRTGYKPVTETEYLSYILSIGRPEFGTAIDLPTKLWLEEIALYAKPMPEADRAVFEKRLDAWSGYLMGLYKEAYGTISKNLRDVDQALRNSSSVQSDHAPVRMGQNFPSAYSPLDFQYQSTWNDQVGGPDYAYQWLLLDALLEMERGNKPTWISNALGAAHSRANIPGKFTRVAAHGLAFGSSGIGFSHEGFSNILGGMNAETNWQNIKGKSGEADLVSGRDFMDRFSSLAVNARSDHGVGILWSKTQYGRQDVNMGFGRATFNQLVALTRLGYTPRFVTEDEIATGKINDIQALVVISQNFSMPDKVNAGLSAFIKNGGRIFIDESTTINISGAEKMPIAFSTANVGKPHNWKTPNMVGNENDVILYERLHPEIAKIFSTVLGDTGHAWLKSEKGADAKISLLQMNGGNDAKYIIAVNDSYIASQADWHQVVEKLIPLKNVSANSVIYDCTEEKLLGKVAPFDCDLSMTTARVFAILPAEIKTINMSATQSIKAGDNLIIKVEFNNIKKKMIAAVLPFNLSVIRPDGTVFSELYRSTDINGNFSISIPIPINETTGKWSVAIHSQLTGDTAKLPIQVSPAKGTVSATAITDNVVVRNRAEIEKTLEKGTTIVLPVFNEKLKSAAEEVKKSLAGKGINVDIRINPVPATYTIGYEITDVQQQENARIDNGELIGKIKRETTYGNDWASGLSGWRFGKSIILLDIPTDKNINPMAESLNKAGMVWPQINDIFPGDGKAVIQAVPWAFAPRTTAIIIQAKDTAGLIAGAQALVKLPEDMLTPGITSVKSELWKQYHIGGTPEMPSKGKLSAKSLTISNEPKPFTINFPTGKPLTADVVKHPEPVQNPSYPVPGVFAPKQMVIYYIINNKFVETATVEFLMSDLRFSQAFKLIADVKDGGKMNIKVNGIFRYSDRKPCWQAQWEDVINLRDKLVPSVRRPMEIEIQIGGKTVGKLTPSKIENVEVITESIRPTPKKVVEESVTELSGDIEIPTGKQEIMFIPKNIVDGKLEKVGIGQ